MIRSERFKNQLYSNVKGFKVHIFYRENIDFDLELGPSTWIQRNIDNCRLTPLSTCSVPVKRKLRMIIVENLMIPNQDDMRVRTFMDH